MIVDESGRYSSWTGDVDLTVGSLLGQPQRQHQPSSEVQPAPPLGGESSRGQIARSGGADVPATAQEGLGWQVSEGAIATNRPSPGYSSEGIERLSYNNPYAQNIERVWFDGKLVFALDVGEIVVDPAAVKVAQEYQIVYGIELDEHGKKRADPAQVPGQLNIYDSVPGMAKYSPIWQFNYVVVPRDYEANRLRSEADCLNSGFPIKRSNDFEN